MKSVPIHHAGGAGTCASSLHKKKQQSAARKMLHDHRRSFQHQNSTSSLGIIEEHHDEDREHGAEEDDEDDDASSHYFDTECDFSTTDLSLSRLSMRSSETCLSLADLVSQTIDTSTTPPGDVCTMTLSSSQSSLKSFGSGSHHKYHDDEDIGCGTHCYDSNGYHATVTQAKPAAVHDTEDDYCFTFDDDDNYWIG